jgi:serine/threonine-protein kinase
MGDVLAVRDEHLDIIRAIKLLDLEPRPGQKREDAVTEVLKEAVVIAKLHKLCREHIVEVLFVGQTADSHHVPYIVMELIDGAPLRDLLKRRGGKLDPIHVRQVGVDVLAALAAAHDMGIVHRDLKPANIMCEMLDQNRVRMKVIDFGIVGGVNQRTKRIAGTFRYAAPEQIHISGPSPLMAQTDLYALGCILYECLAGQGPFDSYCRTNEHFMHAHLTARPPLISTILPGISKEFDAFFASILAKDPAQRPASARACAAQLMDLPWEFPDDADATKTEEMLEAAIQSVVRKHEENRGGVVVSPQAPAARSPGQPHVLGPTGTVAPVNAVNMSARGGTLRVEAMSFSPPPDPRNLATRTSSPAVLPQTNDARDPSTFGAVQRSYESPGISPVARRFAAVSVGIATAIFCVTLGVWLAHHRAASSALVQAASASASVPPAAPVMSALAPIDSAVSSTSVASATASTSATASPIASAAADHPRAASPARSHPAHASDSSANSTANSAGISATLPAATASAAAKPRKLPGSGL